MKEQIDKPLAYRYYETAYAIINSLIDAAFTACRYAVQPDESTEKYYERRELTIGIVQNTYVNDLSKILEQIVVAKEESEQDADENDAYELAQDWLRTVLHDISKDLAVAAFELDKNEITEYFKSLPQSEMER